MIRIQIFYLSRIPGSKRHRITDPIRNTVFSKKSRWNTLPMVDVEGDAKVAVSAALFLSSIHQI